MAMLTVCMVCAPHPPRELLQQRADLNLHSELINGTPDVYWSEPALEELYHRVSR